jgi:hypothetical protein
MLIHARRGYLTRKDVFAQIWERYSDDILTDECATTIASWYSGAAALQALAATGEADHGELMWAIRDHARQHATDKREHAALDMLYAWAMIKAIGAGAAATGDQFLEAIGTLAPALPPAADQA